jgi:hypothetical protein
MASKKARLSCPVSRAIAAAKAVSVGRRHDQAARCAHLPMQ